MLISLFLFISSFLNLFSTNNPLDFAKKAIAERHLKIAFIGDSITEGAYLSNPEYSYTNLVVNDLKTKLPDVNIEYHNFAIGSTTTGIFNSNNYVGLSESPSPESFGSGFHRIWGVTGKSWKDTVKDYEPDLLIVAFGMNDAYSEQGTKSYKQNLEEIVSNAKIWVHSTSIVLVSPIYPTTDQRKYDEKQESITSVVNDTKTLALEKNVAFADANHLYTLLRDGKENFYNEKELLGNFGEKIDGNGINHPTPLVHKIVYFKAFEEIISKLAKY